MSCYCYFFSWYCAMYVVYLSSSIIIRTWVYIYTILSNLTRTVSHHVRHDEWHILTTLILRKCGGVKFDGWTTQSVVSVTCYVVAFIVVTLEYSQHLFTNTFFSPLKKNRTILMLSLPSLNIFLHMYVFWQ